MVLNLLSVSVYAVAASLLCFKVFDFKRRDNVTILKFLAFLNEKITNPQ